MAKKPQLVRRIRIGAVRKYPIYEIYEEHCNPLYLESRLKWLARTYETTFVAGEVRVDPTTLQE